MLLALMAQAAASQFNLATLRSCMLDLATSALASKAGRRRSRHNRMTQRIMQLLQRNGPLRGSLHARCNRRRMRPLGVRPSMPIAGDCW